MNVSDRVTTALSRAGFEREDLAQAVPRLDRHLHRRRARGRRSSSIGKRVALALVVTVAAVLVAAPPAQADDVAEDPTKDWPVHFDPSPPRPAPPAVVLAQRAPEPVAISADEVWQRKLRRHHLEGALGFAGTYGAAAGVGGIITGLVLSHDADNPGSDGRAALKWVALPLFTPVVGPIFLGGAVAINYTVMLFTSGSTNGEGGAGVYVALAVILAPVAYGFSALAIVDGVMQGAFLKQALGWSDPPRSASTTTRAKPIAWRTLLTIAPMVVPEVQAPAWASAFPASGLPSAVGLQVPVVW